MSLEEKKLFVIYSKPNCPWCSMASHLLELNGLLFEEYKEENEIQRKQSLLNFKENYSLAKDHNTFPVVLLMENPLLAPKFIGGCVDLMDYLVSNGYKTSKV